MKIGKKEGQDHVDTLRTFLQRYRSTPHSVTGVIPAELFLNRPLRTAFDLLKPNVREEVASKQAKQKHYRDRKQKQLLPPLELGQ